MDKKPPLERRPSKASSVKSHVSAGMGASHAATLGHRAPQVQQQESSRVDNVGLLRKNKAYQQLKREMEQRNRQRKKMEPTEMVRTFKISILGSFEFSLG